MNRFFQPGNNPKLEFETKNDVDLAFDAAAFQLRVRANQKGACDIVLSAPPEKGKLTTVLTLAGALGMPVHRFVIKPESASAAGTAVTTTSRKVFLAGFNKLELAQAFLMSIDGVPTIYYGDEIGMTDAGDPDNRRDMRFGDQVSSDEKRVLENFKKLGAIRRQHPALRCGSRRTVLETQDQYAFVRAHLDDRIAVVFNRGKSEAKIGIDVSPELSDGEYLDAVNGRRVHVKDGKLNFALSPQTAAFIVKSR